MTISEKVKAMKLEADAKELKLKFDGIKPVLTRQVELPDVQGQPSGQTALICQPQPSRPVAYSEVPKPVAKSEIPKPVAYSEIPKPVAKSEIPKPVAKSEILKRQPSHVGVLAPKSTGAGGIVSQKGSGARRTLANYIKDQTGEQGESLANIMLSIAAGKFECARPVVTKNGDVIDVKFKPTIPEVMQAVMWLTDRAHGKAKDIIQLEQVSKASVDIDYSVLSVEELRTLKDLHTKALHGQRAIASSTTTVSDIGD